ncbi:MAG: hypothetical protein KME08_01170 [Aphanothece sp. CMT-3BRIN-NPC111]|nr:hypothetical protein [Aphanothece sp. CMT-3BRIN-NPC111]
MDIKPMLMRLQSALGRDDLIEQMILLSESKKPLSKSSQDTKSVNLIVGYNSSTKSHTALDLTLCIAHQTRLATKAQVTVQVVYVIEDNQRDQCPDSFSSVAASSPLIEELPGELAKASASSVLTPSRSNAIAEGGSSLRDVGGTTIALRPQNTSLDAFAQADDIFWQARCLAEEWQNSFQAHIRFGCVATELKKVVELEAAALLFLGCNSVNHPIVQKLGSNFPCSVLGIPDYIED